jgi:hypothetical protein
MCAFSVGAQLQGGLIVVAMDVEAIDLSAVYISASLFDGSEFVTKRTTI